MKSLYKAKKLKKQKTTSKLGLDDDANISDLQDDESESVPDINDICIFDFFYKKSWDE